MVTMEEKYDVDSISKLQVQSGYVLEIKTFTSNHVGQTFKYLFKNFFCGFYNLVVASL